MPHTPTHTGIPEGFELVSPAAEPRFGELLQQILGQIPEVQAPPPVRGVEQLLPEVTPLISLILGPLLAELAPQEQRARQELTGAFRAAGGGAGPARGTPFAQALGQLEEGFLRTRGGLLSRVLGQTISPLLQSLLEEQRQEQAAFETAQRQAFLPTEALLNTLRLISPELVDLPGAAGARGGVVSPTGQRGPVSDPFGVIDFARQARERALAGQAGARRPAPRRPAARPRAADGRAPAAPTEPDFGLENIPLLPGFGGAGDIQFNPVTGFFETAPTPGGGVFTPEQGGPSFGVFEDIPDPFEAFF